MTDFWHRVRHWVGWAPVMPVSARSADGALWMANRCRVCGRISGRFVCPVPPADQDFRP